MAGTFKLSLSIQVTEHEVLARTQGFRLLMTATPVSGFDDGGVFVFLRSTQSEDIFQNVASPSNLEEIDLDTYTAEGWVRRSSIDLLFSSRAEANGVAADIEEQLTELCNEMYKLLTDLAPAETVIIQSDD